MLSIDAYLDRVAAHLDVDEMDRLQILAELRNHLFEAAQAQRAAQPERNAGDVEGEVVAALGDPAALALAYGPGGRVELRRADGQTVLRFSAAVRRAQKAVDRRAAAVGRGTGRALRGALLFLLVAFGVTLVAATVLAVVLFDDVEELVRSQQTEQVLFASDRCNDQPCNATTPTVRSFHVHGDAKEVRFTLDVDTHQGVNGSLHVRVVDPNGNLVLDRSFGDGRNGGTTEAYAWAPTAGTWRVESSFDGFQGSAWVEVRVLGLPR